MFRTRLNSDDTEYFYSHDVTNILFGNSKNKNEAFFDMIRENEFAKENLDEFCFSYSCKSYYENDLIEDMNNSEYFIVQKDVLGNPILITHDFENIEFYVTSLFGAGEHIELAEVDQAESFMNGFYDISKGIEYAAHIILQPHHSDKDVFMSELIPVEDIDIDLSYKVFFDLSDKTFSIQLQAKFENGFFSSNSKTVEESFQVIGNELLKSGKTIQEVQSIFEKIKEHIVQ